MKQAVLEKFLMDSGSMNVTDSTAVMTTEANHRVQDVESQTHQTGNSEISRKSSNIMTWEISSPCLHSKEEQSDDHSLSPVIAARKTKEIRNDTETGIGDRW